MSRLSAQNGELLEHAGVQGMKQENPVRSPHAAARWRDRSERRRNGGFTPEREGRLLPLAPPCGRGQSQADTGARGSLASSFAHA